MDNHMKIGEKIKMLRKVQDMTQEKLADYLGVSFQAISKWECGFASPDISLLIPLSRLFGVTIDELFDNTQQQKDARHEELKKAIGQTWQTGDVLKRYALAKTAVEEYPGDMDFLHSLSCGEFEYSYETDVQQEKIMYLESSIKHAKTVIENTDDTALKEETLNLIVTVLLCLDRREEALRYAELTKDEDIIIRCLTGEERAKRTQALLNYKFESLVRMLSSYDARIEALDAADTIIKAMIPDGNYLFYLELLYHNEIWRAMHYTKAGQSETAIAFLKSAYHYAFAYDAKVRNAGPQKYTAPMLDAVVFDHKTLYCSGTATSVENFREYLGWKCFDPLRDMPEFKELYDSVEV